MTREQYLRIFLVPYALVVAALAIGLGWTQKQQESLDAHESRFESLTRAGTDRFAAQCTFDEAVVDARDRIKVPGFCVVNK